MNFFLKYKNLKLSVIFSVSARAGNNWLLVLPEENPPHASLEISLLSCKTEPTLPYYTNNILSHNWILNIIVAEYCLALCLHQLRLVNSLSPKWWINSCGCGLCVAGLSDLGAVFVQETFERAKAWVKELQRQASPNIVIALAGNKADLAERRLVEYEVTPLFVTIFSTQTYLSEEEW